MVGDSPFHIERSALEKVMGLYFSPQRPFRDVLSRAHIDFFCGSGSPMTELPPHLEVGMSSLFSCALGSILSVPEAD